MSSMNLNHEEYVTVLETQDDSFYFFTFMCFANVR